MKIKLGTDKIFYLIILSYVAYITILIINHQPNPFWGFGFPTTAIYKNDLKPIDENIPDTIPFKKYQKLKDSINTIRDVKNGDEFLAGGSANFPGWVSTWCSRSCDTCSLKWLNRLLAFEDTSHIQYYIRLNGWTLKTKARVFTQADTSSVRFWDGPDSVEFYVKGKQSYLRKVLKKNYRGKDGTDYYLVDIPVKYRFSYKEKCLMIPISRNAKKTLDIVFVIIDIFWIVYAVLLVLEFFAFIYDLSKGMAFTDRNVKYLKMISLSLLIYPILLFLLNLVTRLIFNSYFTADVVLNSDVYSTLWKIIVIGFVFFVLFRAFKTGKALKEEHDLTV